MNNKRAFTLIELLTVVVIIGILIGLLSAVLQQARTRARLQKCAGETRELSKAWAAYYSTYDALPGGSEMDPALVDILQGNNPQKIKYMDFPVGSAASGFLDPWGRPYKVTLSVRDMTNTWAYATRVYMVNRKAYQHD